jgi:hypothetical protein
VTPITTRRLRARPVGVALLATGCRLAKPSALRRFGLTPCVSMNCRTALARSLERYQFEGNSGVSVGTLSV